MHARTQTGGYVIGSSLAPAHTHIHTVHGCYVIGSSPCGMNWEGCVLSTTKRWELLLQTKKKMNCRLRCDKLAFFKTNENAANPQAPQSCFACPSAHSVAQGIVHEFHWEQSMKQEVFKSRKGQPQIMWVK